MTTQELLVGERVRSMRESALLSQADLARAMRALGTKWAQNTVSAIEKGERPLRLTEAVKVAEACGFDPVEFLGNDASNDRDGFRRGVEASIRALSELIERQS